MILNFIIEVLVSLDEGRKTYFFFFNAEIGGWVPGFYTETGKEDGLRSLIHLLVISLCEFVLNVSSGLFQITCLHSKQKLHLLEGK